MSTLQIIPQYSLHLGDQAGNRKANLTGRFEEITVTLRLNGPNTCHVVCKSVVDNKLFPYALLKEDAWLEVWRGVNDRPQRLLGESPFLLSDKIDLFYENNLEKFKLDALSASVVANWPVVAYDAGSSQADKTDFADDMIKAIALENIGSSATDTDRNMSTLLQIQADRSAAVSLSKAFSRRKLAAVFTDLCNASAAQGTRLYWDVVLPVPGNLNNRVLELRTYTQHRGVYRGFNLDNPLVFSREKGNLDNIHLITELGGVANYVYGAGHGREDKRVVQPASDSARIAASPWGRIKEDVRETGSASGAVVLADARGRLREKRPRVVLTADIIQTPKSIFGVHYDHGDVVGVEVFGGRYEAIISPVTITRRGEVETIRAAIRVEL